MLYVNYSILYYYCLNVNLIIKNIINYLSSKINNLYKFKKHVRLKIFFNLKFYLINKILINKIINIFINKNKYFLIFIYIYKKKSKKIKKNKFV